MITKKNYVLPLSNNLLLTNLCGHRVFCDSDKFNKMYNEYHNIKETIDAGFTKGTCMYSVEIRCRYPDVNYAVKYIDRNLSADNFCSIENSDFFRILQTNINMFIELIKTGGRETTHQESDIATKPDTLMFSQITEYIFKTFYLAGARPTLKLSVENSRILKTFIPIFQNSVGILENLKRIVFSICRNMSNTEKSEIIKRQIIYQIHILKFKRSLLCKVIDVFFCKMIKDLYNETSFIYELMICYIMERLGKSVESLEILQKNHENAEKSVHTKKELGKILIHKNLAIKSSIVKIMFSLFKTKFGYDDEKAIDKIAKFFIEFNIKCLFRYKKTGCLNMFRLIDSNKRTGPSQSIQDIERERIFNMFVNESVIEPSKVRKVM